MSVIAPVECIHDHNIPDDSHHERYPIDSLFSNLGDKKIQLIQMYDTTKQIADITNLDGRQTKENPNPYLNTETNLGFEIPFLVVYS